MKIRGILTAAAAALAVAGAAVAGPGTAGAATTASTPAASTASTSAANFVANAHIIDLQAQYTNAAAARIAVGPRAGIVPPVHATGAAAKAATASAAVKGSVGAANCGSEPNCNLDYNGGPVQHRPKVYVIFWGKSWLTNTGEGQSGTYLLKFFQGLGTSSDNWSTITSQYTDASGSPTFGSRVYVSYAIDKGTPPSSVSETNLGTEALAAAKYFKITDFADDQVVIVSQHGTCFDDGFVGDPGTCSSTPPAYCAWHSNINDGSARLSFTNLPYLLDAGSQCGQDFVNSNGTWDGFSIVGGHEYAESITDPQPDLGWFDNSDTVSGGEIGDKCAWGGTIWGTPDPIGNITLSTGTFAVQSLWDNHAAACSMQATATPPITASATSPGHPSTITGHSVSLAITTSTSKATGKHFEASGLPTGLSINAATGVISGKVTGSVKNYAVTVAFSWARGAGYSNGTIKLKFTWSVGVVGAVKGTWGKCLDDANAKTTAGNKIDIWSCTGHPGQSITFYQSGNLLVLGHCVTTTATAIVLETCNGGTNKKWTRNSKGEYVSSATGKCLTDPHNSKANGTALTPSTCQGATDQKWSLP